jgi:hypothetical protein
LNRLASLPAKARVTDVELAVALNRRAALIRLTHHEAPDAVGRCHDPGRRRIGGASEGEGGGGDGETKGEWRRKNGTRTTSTEATKDEAAKHGGTKHGGTKHGGTYSYEGKT